MTIPAGINAETAPQTAHLLRWVEAERKKGLVDIKFLKKDTATSTVESFCAEVNAMLQAPVLEDSDLF